MRMLLGCYVPIRKSHEEMSMLQEEVFCWEDGGATWWTDGRSVSSQQEGSGFATHVQRSLKSPSRAGSDPVGYIVSALKG